MNYLEIQRMSNNYNDYIHIYIYVYVYIYIYIFIHKLFRNTKND